MDSLTSTVLSCTNLPNEMRRYTPYTVSLHLGMTKNLTDVIKGKCWVQKLNKIQVIK